MAERLTVSAFARAAGCDEKQVRRAVEKGALTKGEDGLLDPAAVNSAWRRQNRRTVVRRAAALSDKTSDTARTGDDDENVRTEEGERLGGTLNDALLRKERALAQLKELEFDQKAGAVVSVGEVAKLVGEEYARVRTRLLSLPSERAPAIFRLKSAAEVEAVLRSAIVEALEELTRDGASAAA